MRYVSQLDHQSQCLKRGSKFKRNMALTVVVILWIGLAIEAVGNSDGQKGTVAGMTSLFVALDSFEVDTGRYPASSEGLAALIVPPESTRTNGWRGPYLKKPENLKDRWGRAFVYQCPGVHNTNTFDLYSLGPDGVSKSGGDDPDDIKNWAPPNGPPSYLERILATPPETIRLYVGVPIALVVLVAAICGSFLRFFRKEDKT